MTDSLAETEQAESKKPFKRNPDVQTALDSLAKKSLEQTRYWQYYDGDQPLIYTSRRLETVFQKIDARFTENWCAVVIDSCDERINLTGFEITDTTAHQLAARIWEQQELDLESDEAHQAMQVAGESFVIVWLKEESAEAATAASAEAAELRVVAEGADLADKLDRLQIYFNDARLCHVEYQANDPRRMAWAAKWWDGADGHKRLTLYYPDRLEYYRCRKKSSETYKAADFVLDPDLAENPAENPYGRIPFFHFRLGRRRIKSDLKNVIEPQDGINKLLTDLMVTAEFNAFPQRYIISNAEDVGQLPNAPGFNWLLPAGDGTGQGTSVGQLSAADLSTYLKSIESIVASGLAIARLPKHYLYLQNGDPSGEALIAMEAPLVKKAKRRIERAAPVWKAIMAFALELLGLEVRPDDITPKFDPPETIQPKTEAAVVKDSVVAGMPLRTALRKQGWSEAELEKLDQDQAEQAQRESDSLAQQMVEARRRFDRGQEAA